MKDMRKTWQDYQDESCDFETTFACQMLTMSLDLEAKTLVLSLDGAMKPGVPTYIGAPPAEIEKLVADTRTAAQAVDDAIPDGASTDNGELTASARFAVNDLMSTFDRWDRTSDRWIVQNGRRALNFPETQSSHDNPFPEGAQIEDEMPGVRVFVEDWAASYGSPYLIPNDDQGTDTTVLVEDGAELRCRIGRPYRPTDGCLAFVDGVRRGEAWLWIEEPATGGSARGVAGGHACGAVIADGQARAAFGETRIHRLAIWGSGLKGQLPPVTGGWTWESRSIADPNPDAPLRDLQTRMRQDEGRLAEAMCQEGHLTIIDGPLNFVRSRDLPVVGCVKTHHRVLLDPEHHRRIPELGAGERTSLFRLGEDRYSAYLRLTPVSATAGPWSGIVRIEIPQSAGLADAITVADRVAGALPLFAGVAHRDPRAPQNLQPIGALEKHLRHLLGNAGLAVRAVRESVARLILSTQENQ